jgi:hypothetical protein
MLFRCRGQPEFQHSTGFPFLSAPAPGPVRPA